MNAVLLRRLILPVFLLLAGLQLATGVASATEPGAPILHAGYFLEIVSDRARLIQVSLVVVTLGCALLWWRR